MFFNLLPSAQVSFPICPLEDYNADATTKQNILCDGRAARRVIRDSLLPERSGGNGTLADGITQPRKNGSDLRFEYLLPSRPQLFVLVLDRSSLPPAAVEDAPGKEVTYNSYSLSGTIKKTDWKG